MIVVPGATGLLGNVLVRGLVAQGVAQLRALVRPSSDLTAIAGLEVESAHGDVRDRSSLVAAFAGADTVFHQPGRLIARETPGSGKRNVEGRATCWPLLGGQEP
jgi:uncharacterized protein YbjT (DUF2867 family)